MREEREERGGFGRKRAGGGGGAGRHKQGKGGSRGGERGGRSDGARVGKEPDCTGLTRPRLDLLPGSSCWP